MLSSFRPMVAVIFLVVLLAMTGCSPSYVAQVGWGQATILWARTPVQKLLREKRLSTEEEAKIRLILRVKRYGKEELGLVVEDHYTDFVRIEGNEVCYALSACPPDSLEPYQWWFPIVGKLPYLGFFSPAAALREKKRLESKGYDTYLRGVAAYSTLGWFRDPIFSSMLAYGEVPLADIIFHELLHNTVFAKNQMDFNESLATFVGQQGAIAFFCAAEGHASTACRTAKAMAHDELHLSRFLETVYERLHALYASPLSRREKLERREEIFRLASQELQETQQGFLTDSYRFLDKEPLNNASLLAFRTYHRHLVLYRDVYEKSGQSLRRTIELFRHAADAEEDPLAWAASWLGKADSEPMTSPPPTNPLQTRP